MPIPSSPNRCSPPCRLFFSFPTACQCCWPKPKLNAFVPSLFSLTLIEFCEFHLPHSPAIDCLCSFFHSMCCYSSSCSCCCYERFLTAFLFVGPLATHPTGSWCHFYMAEFIMDNNKNCRKLLPTTRRREREREMYTKLGSPVARLSCNPTGIALTFTIWSMARVFLVKWLT